GPWRQSSDSVLTLGVGHTAPTAARSNWSGLRSLSALSALSTLPTRPTDGDRRAENRLPAVRVNHAPRYSIGFDRRSHTAVDALAWGPGLNFAQLGLRLVDRVGKICQWIANSPAHPGPVGAARTDQIISRRQAVNAIYATIVCFVIKSSAAVEWLYLAIGV